MGEGYVQQMDEVQLTVDQSSSSQPAESTDPNAPSTEPTAPPPPSEIPKRLVGVFAAASALAIFLWFMVGAGFPWFIYIVYCVAVIDCIIYAVSTKNSFFANWSIFASTNVMIFITFLACGGGYPWFVMVFCSTAIFPVTQYLWQHYQSPLRWLYIHAAIYLLMNMMIFFIWLVASLTTSWPWFIYPWCGWGVGLLAHYNAVVMHDKSRLFVFVCADLGIMLLITFRFAIGPLFMVFLLVALLAIVLYYLLLKKGYAAHCWCLKRNNPAQPQDATTSPSPAPAPQPQQGFALPQVQFAVQPVNQQFVPPPGAVYFSAGQVPQSYPVSPVPPQGGGYYAYFPSNGGAYPTYSTVPPRVNAEPTAPVPFQQSDAVLTSIETSPEKERKGKEEKERLIHDAPPSDK